MSETNISAPQHSYSWFCGPLGYDRYYLNPVSVPIKADPIGHAIRARKQARLETETRNSVGALLLPSAR